jgi:hypothetical protein
VEGVFPNLETEKGAAEMSGKRITESLFARAV